MSEETTGTVGGFRRDLAEAVNPAPGTGCCASPAANTCGPCCGTAAEAEAEDACCGTQARAEAVASGTSCCG